MRVAAWTFRIVGLRVVGGRLAIAAKVGLAVAGGGGVRFLGLVLGVSRGLTTEKGDSSIGEGWCSGGLTESRDNSIGFNQRGFESMIFIQKTLNLDFEIDAFTNLSVESG